MYSPAGMVTPSSSTSSTVKRNIEARTGLSWRTSSSMALGKSSGCARSNASCCGLTSRVTSALPIMFMVVSKPLIISRWAMETSSASLNWPLSSAACTSPL